MARTGKLPQACYHKELWPSVTRRCNVAIDCEQESMELDTGNADEILEYDTNIEKTRNHSKQNGKWDNLPSWSKFMVSQISWI